MVWVREVVVAVMRDGGSACILKVEPARVVGKMERSGDL